MKKFVLNLFFTFGFIYAVETREVLISNEIAGVRIAVYYSGLGTRSGAGQIVLRRVAMNTDESVQIDLAEDTIWLSVVGGQRSRLRKPQTLDQLVKRISVQQDGIHFEDDTGMVSISDL